MKASLLEQQHLGAFNEKNPKELKTLETVGEQGFKE